jgi:HEAT repeat protein
MAAPILFFLALVCGLLGACTDEHDSAVVQLDLRDSVRALGSDDLQVASTAESRLVAIGPPALPVLAAALRQEPEAVRVGVIDVLVEMEGEEVSALLVGALGDPAEAVRADAAMALRMHRGPAVEEALVRALEDPSETVRQRAAIACASSCRSADSATALVPRALDDPAAPVGWTAVSSLGRLQAGEDQALTRAIATAVEAAAPARLDRPDAGQRARAAVLLASIGDMRAVPVLEALLVERDTRLRVKAIHALGQVGGPNSIAVLRGLLAEPGIAVYAHDALRRAAGRGVAGADAALAGYTGQQSPVPLPPPP